jgi:hypothetical protein
MLISNESDKKCSLINKRNVPKIFLAKKHTVIGYTAFHIRNQYFETKN